MTKLVHVAVGVIVNVDGKILIAKRALSAHQGGLWEFPGGKVDAGETVQQALIRELREELAIEVVTCEPLIQIRHHYSDKSVLLDVYKITQFNGEPRGNEGQPILWADAKQLHEFEFPAANHPIINAINLPSTYMITGGFQDEAEFSMRLDRALAVGIKIVQLRIENFDLKQHQALLEIAVSSVNKTSAHLMINTTPASFSEILKNCTGSNIGLHLSSKRAAMHSMRPVDDNIMLGVSCHNAEEISHAQKIGADYLLISPVLPTRSHPAVSPLGWSAFANLVELANVPVYALGGVGDGDVLAAQKNGAQGVAGISAWW